MKSQSDIYNAVGAALQGFERVTVGHDIGSPVKNEWVSEAWRVRGASRG